MCIFLNLDQIGAKLKVGFISQQPGSKDFHWQHKANLMRDSLPLNSCINSVNLMSLDVIISGEPFLCCSQLTITPKVI